MTTALAEPVSRAASVAPGHPADNPLAMLAAALERGHDPDKLEKLMDLADRWKDQRAVEAFNEAMNAAQAEMPCIVRDKQNTFTKTRYASLENVNTLIRPVYTRHGFSLTYGTEDSKLADHTRIVCDVAHGGGHTRRYHLDIPLDSAGMKGGSNKSGAQAMGSTISYGRRYLALMIFNVTVADEDLDGNRAGSLDTITEADALDIEDQLDRKKVHRAKFIEWCKTAGYFVGDEARITALSLRALPEVLRTLKAKCDRDHDGPPCGDSNCHLKRRASQ